MEDEDENKEDDEDFKDNKLDFTEE